MNGSTVAVLGGTGWLGRHVCELFARRGYGVLAVARNRTPSGCRFHALDLTVASTEDMANLFRAERVDVVVNAADSMNTTDSWLRTEAEHLELNVAMVRRLLAAIGSLPWRARFVHLGTIIEYHPVVPGTAIAETHQTNPVHPYSRSKVTATQAVLDAARADVADGAVLRLGNLCGPHASPHSLPGRLVQLLKDANGSDEITVTVTDAWRDFVDVRDVAEAVFAAAEKAVCGSVINIGSGVPVPIRELVCLFFAEVGLPPDRLNLRHGPVRQFGGDWTKVDITLAHELLSWQPRIDLRTSLRDLWHSAR